ncbi:uroporphyrinogen decarboxylase family protein [Desulfomonile tiedjei]|uniref:uroporphyrinogen decarboxylase family protein n=1 Tax=Desulfomonile tiedjei TaxID=2358 RepID=UPI0002E270D5|nr:uroporphyrinogen decarboxylase family protein [Desulfomonile tiedjei]
MGKQDVIDAVKGLPTEKVPWVPYAGVHCAHMIDQPADKYLQDPDLIVEGVMFTAERYKADGIPLLFDLTVEAISMGCDHKWWPDNPPSITGHPLDKQNLVESGIKIPGPKDGRWPVIVEAGRRLKAAMPDVALFGILCGPLTLASHLRGVRIFTDVYKNKVLAKEIVDFCGQVAGESARIYAEEIGCDVIAITDPVASQIKPETFREFVTPACQPAIQAARKAGKVSSFFICGDATKVLEEVAQVGTDGFAIDEQLNLTYVRDVARKHNVGFGGNLKLTLALSLGIVSPREDAIASLAAGGSTGYVFAPG